MRQRYHLGCYLKKIMNSAKKSSGIGVGQSEKMICVECFRAKGDEDLKMPCQNPRCHFYLCTPSYFSSSRQDRYPPETSPSFNKEVGHDRKKAQFHNPAENYHSQLFSKDWQSQLLDSNASLQKKHSKPVPTSSCSGGNVSMARLMSSSHLSKETPRHKYLHSHYVSCIPDYADSYLGREDQFQSDLVEDAFVSSPLLMDYGERGDEDQRRSGVPERDHCGFSGPFGRTAGLMDWMDGPSTKAPHVPAALTVPTVPSSSSAATSTFDMTQLKMEMSKAINSQVENSLAANGRVSSPEFTELLKQPSMNSITSILGLGGLLQCTETYSRKVFVGGLPPEVDEDDIRVFFMRFGSLTVDWPHKNHNRGCIPPKGYAFLLFKNESSVHKLLLSCKPEEDKHFIYMPTANLAKKKVQIRPWYVSDSYHAVDTSKPIDPRKAVFVGGVPRPLKACELAEVMTEKYGNVALIVIDSDSDLKYPKGAACVVFSSHASYIAAVSARFMQLTYGSLDKKVEIKPYVLDGQMCDECTGVQCSGKPAPFFCGSVTCLQYYCEYCWATVHSMPGRQNHRPLLKDIGDKARFY